MKSLSRFFVPKRLLAVLIALLCAVGAILYFARSPRQQDFDLTRSLSALSGSFSTTISMQLPNFQTQAQYTQTYIGNCSFTFTSPPSLDGFTVTLQDGEVLLSFAGLDCAVSSSELFEQSGAGKFCSVMKALSAGQGIESEQTEEGTKLSFYTESGSPCTVLLDAQSGALLGATLGDDCSFSFEDFSFAPQTAAQQTT